MTTEATALGDLFSPPTEPIEQPAPLEAPKKRSARNPLPKSDDLAIGAYPIAHLLPPEVTAQGKVKATRALMGIVVVVVLVLSGAAVGGAYALRLGAEGRLASVQDQNASVVAQQAKYAPVRTAQSKVKLAQAAQQVGSASEIDWSAMFAKAASLMPAGASITDYSGQTGNAVAAVTQDTQPLSPSRGALVTLTISAPDPQTIANAADALSKLPGAVGVGVGALSQAGSGAAASASAPWSAPVTVSLNSAAYSGRFATK